ncbi:FtsX-like permease family protein [Eggerthellaceae bacterium zg-893]|nr:FtsX-like permease family protein [Eggerthellaceae bacterium zg-893]
MLLKLALRNIRRSVRDYAVYFVTLVMGVAVFYAFNSIGSQSVLFDLESSAAEKTFDMVTYFMGLFSVVVACVLAFLVIYANRFLIRRRRHEFGMYFMLGMRGREVSFIVIVETVVVGLVSLAVGLAVGFALSQGLSFATASLFAIPMTRYQFVFSSDALAATLACFVVLFVLVGLFNLVTVGRTKLIDLFTAHVRNERNVVRNPWVCLVGFVASIGILAVAYDRCIKNGLVMFDEQFLLATVLMLVGTLLLFWSLSGFVIAVLTRARGVYLRGLVPFTVRQIASKVNTAFLSLWVVCVMLFFAITTFSCGMGLVQAFTDGAEAANPYDATLSAQIIGEVEGDASSQDARARYLEENYPELYAEATAADWDLGAYLAEHVPGFSDAVSQWAQVDTYEVAGLTFGDLIDAAGLEDAALGREDVRDSMRTQQVQVSGVSQVNDALALQGLDLLNLEENQMLLANNADISAQAAQALAESGVACTVGGRELTMRPEVADFQIQDHMMEATIMLIVVPDDVVEALRDEGAIPWTSVLDVSYVEAGAAGDAALSEALAAAYPTGTELPGSLGEGYASGEVSYERTLWPVSQVITRQDMMDQGSSLRMLITFLAIYIGFVLLITTAAVLAIQQLSEASDSEARYRMLSRLGCDASMLNRSLFVQVLVYFLAPLVVAACHSACAIVAMRETLFSAFGIDATSSIVAAALFTAAVYGVYFLVTYFASRSLVRQAVAVR